MEIIIEIVGWAGTFLFVCAYYLVSNNKLDATGRKYLLLNLIGAFGVGANVLYKHAWPALGLEIIWITITLIALTKNSKQRINKSSIT